MPVSRNHLKSHFFRSQCRYRRAWKHRSMNEKTFGINCIYQKFLFFNILDSVSRAYTLLCDCRGRPKNERFPVQLRIWYSCITQRKRACTVLLKMIGVHLTYLLSVQAQKVVLSNFVKLTSNAFALTCMIFAWFELMLPRMILTLTLADSLRNRLHEKKIAGNDKVTLQFLDHHHGTAFVTLISRRRIVFWPCGLEYSYSAEFQCLAISGWWRRTANRNACAGDAQMLWRGSRLSDEYQVDGSAVLLRASFCFALYMACQRHAHQPRLATSRLPPRPSRRNKGIGPEGATSLARPLVTLAKSQGLELRYGRLAACGGGAWWTGGRAEGKCEWAWCQGGREYCQLRHVHPSALPRADRLFPHSRQLWQPAPLPAVGATPSAPAARRPWWCRSRGWATCRTWTASALAASLARLGGLSYLNLCVPGHRTASRYYCDYCDYWDYCVFL